MTEAEWLACDDPRIMWHLVEDKANRRKILLVFCAEFRPASHLKWDDRVDWALGVAERLADGLPTEDERVEAYELAAHATDDAVAKGDFAQAAVAAGMRDCLGG